LPLVRLERQPVDAFVIQITTECHQIVSDAGERQHVGQRLRLHHVDEPDARLSPRRAVSKPDNKEKREGACDPLRTGVAPLAGVGVCERDRVVDRAGIRTLPRQGFML